MREFVARVRGSRTRATYPGLPGLRETVVVAQATGPATRQGRTGASALPRFGGATSRRARVRYPGTPPARARVARAGYPGCRL